MENMNCLIMEGTLFYKSMLAIKIERRVCKALG